MLRPHLRNIIHLADKYAYRREHTCLLPGCKKKAIRSHAIPRASLIEALADNGVVYAHRYSFASMMRMTTPGEPIEIVEVGVKKACVFKGYCAEHDTRLFTSADIGGTGDKKIGIAISLHLRALSLEYCRKRLVADFATRLFDLAKSGGVSSGSNKSVEHFTAGRDRVKAILDYMFINAIARKHEGINYFIMPFSRNLQLSCCGVFDQVIEDRMATIGYNIISRDNMSVLCLTTFKSTEEHLKSFLAEYGIPGTANPEQLVNDVAFSKGEEPVISPLLWRSLTKDEQLHVRQSLRPPKVRMCTAVPRVIKLSRDDFVSEPTPAMWARFLSSLYEQ